MSSQTRCHVSPSGSQVSTGTKQAFIQQGTFMQNNVISFEDSDTIITAHKNFTRRTAPSETSSEAIDRTRDL
ncbi:uncharacterized protein PHALS_11014 [Plasmopara halstedii]|uniref:Uncharacterized protein n=1 Tax=Plasmopara halstedii TaxID=4781 RepID=A0A0N7L593_PLAHL|nr:uncharacterized protein PHALS_11014 [Plasmopara halstedii]CEG40835.1 hypothetical protein PHALS_11014 [Plasmopara halstedii]|eukprot:XP_024577204.1 hypothetical protein PHALS_11014 [Plasmopara halstedii]